MPKMYKLNGSMMFQIDFEDDPSPSEKEKVKNVIIQTLVVTLTHKTEFKQTNIEVTIEWENSPYKVRYSISFEDKDLATETRDIFKNSHFVRNINKNVADPENKLYDFEIMDVNADDEIVIVKS